jgi:hypothetical protein
LRYQNFSFYFQENAHNPKNKIFAAVGIWGIVVAEMAVPVLLLFSRTRPFGVLAALCLHTLFGLARNAHFSVVMYAGLILFLPPTRVSLQVIVLSSVVGVLMAFRYSMWKAYPNSNLACLAHACFGAITGYMFALGISATSGNNNALDWTPVDWIPTMPLLFFFVLNATSPFYSSKTEFSLAMFSNLRPDKWSHFIFKRHGRDTQMRDDEYIEIIRMRGVPRLSQCPRASVTYRLVRAFTPYKGRKYLKYYFVESIVSLQDELDSDFFVEVSDGREQFRISSYDDLHILNYHRRCFTPAVLPSDPIVPFCN